MIEIIQKTIHERYFLDKAGRDWLLADKVKLRVPHRRSLAFSLDNQKHPPLAFFGGSPPADMAKMCDAIVALCHREKLYMFIIEQKTRHLDDHEKQLANGKLFCDWLFSLYKRYGYCKEEPIYIGLLVWQPRDDPDKEEATDSPSETRKHKLFPKFFEIRNKLDISLRELVKDCGGKV